MGLVKLNDRGVWSATAFGSLNTGSMTFIKKLTSDGSDDTLSFVDGTDDVVIDSTYKEYLFIFNDIHPADNDGNFQFQGNAAGGSGYNETITSTMFMGNHNETNTTTQFGYETGYDQAQGTGFQALQSGGLIGNGNDECLSGTLRLFNPSSTTFVKHFIYRGSDQQADDAAYDLNIAGYCNTTSAIDGVQFQFNSGNLDAGTFKMYGIKDS